MQHQYSPTEAHVADCEPILEQIARLKLSVTTLATRNVDSLDFHAIAVWRLRAALLEAFRAGQIFQAAGSKP